MTTDLDELDALRAAATPWHEESLFRMLDSIPALRGADAAFIVAACNAVGPLIERVKELEDPCHPTGETYEQLDDRLTDRAEAAEARVRELEQRNRDLEYERDQMHRLADQHAAHGDRLEAGIRALADKWDANADALNEKAREEWESDRSTLKSQRSAMRDRRHAFLLRALLTKGGE